MADSAVPVRLLVAAGGTGGHVYPGIAIAEEWMRLHPDSQVTFVGTTRGVEAKAVPAAGFAQTNSAPANANAVEVRTRDEKGANEDGDFHLVVVCP